MNKAIRPVAALLASTVIATLASGAAQAATSTSCDAAARAVLPKGEILSATVIAKGGFTPPSGPGGPNNVAQYRALPAFCRIEARLFPSADSDIRAEVWAPLEGWNNRLQMVGNGAYMASYQYGDMAIGLRKGYAVVAGNTGHTNDHNADFWDGHPERVIDWQTRAVHESTVAAKLIVATLYGSAPRYSYWNSCSTGGRQGWMAAEYFPDDFDGLAIGDPANPMTRLQASSIWATLALTKTAESFIPAEKWAMIHDTVVKACDARDGLADGMVANPLACNFDPRKLACKAADAATCLTAPQMEALAAVVGGMRNPRNGEQLHPGFPLYTRLLPGPVAGRNPDSSAPTTFRMLFNDPAWDFHTFNFDTDIARSDELGRGKMNAVEPERLAKLFGRGGKILMYHGWDDPAITPLISIKLYQDAVAANPGAARPGTNDSIRLFMIPAKAHCGNPFDQMEPLVKWVEEGIAPDTINVPYKAPDPAGQDRVLPVCAWPGVARYSGKGSPNEPASFVCPARKI